MKIAMIIFIVAILIRLVGTNWSGVDIALLGVIVVSGILVGFAEETLFRGIFLRSMRTVGRSDEDPAVR